MGEPVIARADKPLNSGITSVVAEVPSKLMTVTTETVTMLIVIPPHDNFARINRVGGSSNVCISGDGSSRRHKGHDWWICVPHVL